MMGDRWLFSNATEETTPFVAQLVNLPSEVPASGVVIVTGLDGPDAESAVRAISITSAHEPDVDLPITGDPGGIGQQFYLPATEGGPQALRVFSLIGAEAMQTLGKGTIGVALHERADDPDSMVTRIDIGATDM